MMDADTANNPLTLPSGILRSGELSKLGYSRMAIKRLTERGALLRLSRGLYCTPDSPLTESHSLAEVAKRVPGGIICLVSALQFHRLTTQSPWNVWLMIERHAHTPHLDYPPVEIVRAYGEAFSQGVETHLIEGVSVRITSVPKTVVDCFRYRRRVGMDVALEALREAIRTRRATVAEIGEMACRCRIGTVMRPHLETIAEAYAL